ncbi:hypothetical protein [Cloacibacillus evryensis]|uniref:hypothetical protein n=1 Tax=Cloacibacillus evryensis TaxID=508460 RepID=UPI003AB429E7
MTTPEERSKFTRYLAACEDDIERVANAVDGLKSDGIDTPSMVKMLSTTASLIIDTMKENVSILHSLVDAETYDAPTVADRMSRHSAGLEFLKELANTTIENAQEIPIAGRRMIVILRIARFRDTAATMLDSNTACLVITFLTGKNTDNDAQS